MNDSHIWTICYSMLFFSWGSNGAGKSEFLSQFTCLQPHFYVKYKIWKYNQ